MRLAGLRSEIIDVRVADPLFANGVVLRTLANDVLRYLADLQPGMALPTISEADYYAAATPAARAARDWAARQITLETTPARPCPRPYGSAYRQFDG